MNYTCNALLITCIDFRFLGATRKLLKDLHLEGNHDHHAVAGAALNITRPEEETDREFVFKHIEISKELHKIRKIILINHETCGAYGDENSKEQHLVDLRKAKEILSEQFPDLKVELYFANLEEKGAKSKIEFEEVK